MFASAARDWGFDRSQSHVRRQACLARDPSARDRLVVLAVEQEPAVVSAVADALRGQPIELRICDDAASALLILGRTCPDVVLLGPNGGRLDPVEFISIARTEDPGVPILAGAGGESGEFASRAAAAGATAVIPRPYRGSELLALLRSLAPRPERLRMRPPLIDLGRLRIDGAVPQLWIDGKRITLPPMEFLLLRYFAERVGAVLTREELLDAVWGDGHRANSNTLTVHIMRLRKRLGDDDGEGEARWIRAVRGLGYQFTVPEAADG